MKYGQACYIKTAIIYGGTSKGPQIQAVGDGAQLIIATPGRYCNQTPDVV
jgi:superfamily II DNA/RNA helicase